MSQNPNQISWKVREWAEEAGFSQNYVYELAAAGDIKSIKIRGAVRILISPQEFFNKLEKEQAKNKNKNQSLDLDIAI